MCHVIKGIFNALETSSAKTVLPVPGSPLISNGLSSLTAAFTAIRRSSVAI